MSVLRRGSSGPAVLTLQSTLKQLGFDPRGEDGVYGLGTQTAVIAFQKSKGLTPDGMVGPGTMAALQANAAEAGAYVSGATTDASVNTTPTTPTTTTKTRPPCNPTKLVNGGSHGLTEFSQAFNIGKTVIT